MVLVPGTHGTNFHCICASCEIWFCPFGSTRKNLFKMEEVEILNRKIYRLYSLIQQIFIGSFLLSGTILRANDIVVDYIKPCSHGALHSGETSHKHRDKC